MSNQPDREVVVALLRDLISIPSVNPDGDPGVPPEQCGEAKIAGFLAEFLRSIGADVTLEDTAPERPNVIGRFPSDRPSGDKPRILFGPHSDTVGVGNMTIPPFDPEQRDGRLFGRGACDTKGPMAAMLVALQTLGAEAISHLPCEVHFVAFASEESRQLGSRHFAEHHASKYAFAIIGEPTGMSVVHTHKGCTWCTIDVPGKSVHGSQPELGVNAITAAARIVEHLDTEFREVLKTIVPEDSVLGPNTINIGIIEGGIRANIVPNSCRITVDMRTIPALAEAGMTATGLLTDAVSAIHPDAVVANLTEPTFPLLTDRNDPWAQDLEKATGRGFVGAPWFCDAAHLAVVGLPSVAIGPGSIDQAHTADEWIDINALTESVEMFRTFLTTAAQTVLK